MGNRLVIRLISILMCLFMMASAFLAVFPHQVQAWSAVSAVAPTHQYVLRQAFAQLETDPAFDAKSFPTLNQILAGEGVSLVSTDGIATGPGPDVQKTVLDSDHYYNPRSDIPDDQRGGAPAAVKREYGNLLEALQSKQFDTAGHAACWAAHFLADVETPYHVNGTPFENIDKIYKEQIKSTSSPQYQLFLPENIRGPLTQGYSTVGGKESNATFRPEAESYFAAHARSGNAHKDWFDPWYWNGTSYLTSSHVLWEANVITQVPGVLGKQDMPYTLKGYSKDWKATPGFTTFRQNQLLAVEAFTRATALDGLNNQMPNEKDMGKMAVQKSVQRVLTLWRSTFTALKPSIEIMTPDYNKPENIQVITRVKNVGSGDSQNTQVKLTIAGGTLKGSNTQSVGTVSAGKSGQVTFNVVVSSSQGCSIKLETIGSYSQPDLQYAVVETRSDPLPPSKTPTPTNTTGIDHSIVVLVNCSSQMKSMAFDDILDKIIRALDAFPDVGMEVGLVAYGGYQETDALVLDSGGFEKKNIIRDRLTGNYGFQGEWIGKAPLAEAITRAGQLIQNKAKGNSATIILISSSGVDNCGGDPEAAARGLNPTTVIQREFWIPFNSYVDAASDISVKLQVLGLNVSSSQEEQRLKNIASAGNGKYYAVADISQLAAAAEDAIKSSTSSGFLSGINFQSWWLMVVGVLILLLIVFTLTRRRKQRPALQPAEETVRSTGYAGYPPSPSPGVVAPPHCPKCGNQGMSGAAFCVKCGSSLTVVASVQQATTQSPVYCPQCGTPNIAGSRFCNKCGTSIFSGAEQVKFKPAQPAAKKYYWVWWLLPIFFWLFGGIIAWAALRQENPSLARRILIFGIGITALWAASVIPNLINSF